MKEIHAQAFPRVGLLGNPSDLYGGRGLGFTFDAFAARVTLSEAPRLDFDGAGDDACARLLRAGWDVFRRHALALGEPGLVGGPRLSAEVEGRATVERLAASKDTPERAAAPFGIRVQTDIPRQVGLAGSSALLVAFLRAVSQWCGLVLPAHRIAQLAWRAECEELGILAGPLDRLVQSYEGLLSMDFARPWEAGAARHVDAGLLPPLLLAWDPEPGEPSGAVHEPVHARWKAGDPAIDEVVTAWPGLVDEGLDALVAGDVPRFARAVSRNFDLRARLFPIGKLDHRLVRLGREHGAGAKFCGSGGSVLFVPPDESAGAALRRACEELGCHTLVPSIVGAGPPKQRCLRVVLLAAGFARRLHPLTRDVAKPLLQVGGETVISRFLRLLEATGACTDVVVVTNGRFASQFEEWRDGLDIELPVHLVSNGVQDEQAARGAIADLALALEQAPTSAGPLEGYVVAAGDTVLDASLDAPIARFLERGRSQLVVRRVPLPVPPGRYGEVTLGTDDTVAMFREKPARPVSEFSPLAVYVLPADLPRLVGTYLADPAANRDAPGWFVSWLCNRRRLEAVGVGGRWFDIGDAERLEAARRWAEGPGAS